jgi:methylglutaconyl-CoA hydratase
MNYTTIQVSSDGPVKAITLNRPERRNAMTPEMQNELISAFESAGSGDCRVLVLAGTGQAFCSGLDLSALQAMRDGSPSSERADSERLACLFRTLWDVPVPTIAAVRGPAIAGGAGLAAVCDFALAAPEATFGFTEVRIGFLPAIVSTFLELQVGGRYSSDLLLTGRIIDAAEALRIGLINEIVPAEQVGERARALASTLLQNSPQSLRGTKRLLRAMHKPWLDAALEAAVEAGTHARRSQDFAEGIAAFLEKRKAAWGQ